MSEQYILSVVRALLTTAMCFAVGVIPWRAFAYQNSTNNAGSELVLFTPSDDYRSLVNNKLSLNRPGSNIPNAQQALAAFNEGTFVENKANRVSFGFTEEVLWAVLPIHIDKTKDDGLPAVIEIDNA